MLDRFEQFSFVISGIWRCIQKIERDEMEVRGFRGVYAPFLASMSRRPEGVTAAQLCDLCEKDKAAVSRIVTEMEGKGLIIKQGDKGYRTQLYLTDAGREAADFVCRRAEAAVIAAGEGLTEEDRRIFYRALNLIAANLHEISREGLPKEK